MNIYENLEVKPKAFVVGRALNLDSGKLQKLFQQGDQEAVVNYLSKALKPGALNQAIGMDSNEFITLLIRNFRFEDWAVLEEDIPGFTGGGKGEVTIKAYENERVLCNVKMKGQGLLVLTDNFYPGWEVKVDGKEQTIFRSLSFRAVVLGDGEHEVEFSYHPDSFYIGLKISLACLIFSLLLIFLPMLTAPLRRHLN